MRLFVIILTFFIFLGPPASAVDYNSYRPGYPYLTTPASTPAQCEQQCRGDAMCKSWNFVTINAPARKAVCEYNAKSVEPVPSAISISGTNVSAWSSNRLVPAGHRTTRVGNIPAPKPTSTTRVQRVGLANTRSAQPAKRVIARQPRNPQSLQHSLDANIAAPGFRPQTQKAVSAPANPAFKPLLDTSAPIMNGSTQPRAQQQQSDYQMDSTGITIPSPQIQQYEQVPASAATPPSLNSVAAPPPSNNNQAPIKGSGIDRSLAGAPNPASLYGSLYDDVKIPRTLSTEDLMADPDSPIPTVSSVPISYVSENPL